VTDTTGDDPQVTNDATSVVALRRSLAALWQRELPGEPLPTVWREQVAVWHADGVTPADLRSYFAAWRKKPRIDTPELLWRYLRTCCANRNTPHHRRRNAYRDDPPLREDRWTEPGWMGRDPGPGW